MPTRTDSIMTPGRSHQLRDRDHDARHHEYEDQHLGPHPQLRHSHSTKAIVSVMPEPVSPALKAVSDAVLAVTAERSVNEVLRSRRLRARAGRTAAPALGSGRLGRVPALPRRRMSGELITAMGPLPRRAGCWARCSPPTAPSVPGDVIEDPGFAADRRTGSGHALPPRHADRRPERGDRRPLCDREGDTQCFDESDRGLIELLAAPRRSPSPTPACTARSRAVDPVGAKPSCARAARRRDPEAVQPEPRRRVGGDAAGSRRRGGRASSSCPALCREALKELAGWSWGCGRPTSARRPGGGAAQGGGDGLRVHGIEVKLGARSVPGSDAARDAQLLGSPTRRSATRSATPPPATSRSTCAATGEAARARGRRRRRLRSR